MNTVTITTEEYAALIKVARLANSSFSGMGMPEYMRYAFATPLAELHTAFADCVRNPFSQRVIDQESLNEIMCENCNSTAHHTDECIYSRR